MPWVGRESSYSVSQVSIAPREQEEAQASSGSAGWRRVGGCLSLETLSGKEEFYRLLFTKKKKKNPRPIKHLTAANYRGQLQWFTPAPAPPPRAQLLPPRPLSFCQVFQELGVIWLTSAADVSTHTRPAGQVLQSQPALQQEGSRPGCGHRLGVLPCGLRGRSHRRDSATPAGRFPRHRNLSLHTSPLPCDSDGSLHGQTDQIDLFLHGAPESHHQTRDCPMVSLVRLLSGDPTGVGCNMWSLPGTCMCAVDQLSPWPERRCLAPCHRDLYFSIQADQLSET